MLNYIYSSIGSPPANKVKQISKSSSQSDKCRSNFYTNENTNPFINENFFLELEEKKERNRKYIV